MKEKAIKIDHIKDVPLDIPGAFLRFERRHWKDGTSCLHIMKWGTQPETGRQAPWWPLQYVQVPWDLRYAFTVFDTSSTSVPKRVRATILDSEGNEIEKETVSFSTERIASLTYHRLVDVLDSTLKCKTDAEIEELM